MSKMTKKAPKAKIPRGLTDKDMIKNFVAEDTLEETFAKKEKAYLKKKAEEAAVQPPANLARAGFTPALTDELGRALTELKLALALKGETCTGFKVKREKDTIVLVPKISKAQA